MTLHHSRRHQGTTTTLTTHQLAETRPTVALTGRGSWWRWRQDGVRRRRGVTICGRPVLELSSGLTFWLSVQPQQGLRLPLL
ncbi:hypothetical protein E2C01_000987 [Portunus trituberculatus]|uniref:Uncharacterized protein n=1 Tax=Portunus trituberculatus TaxID=210409 RepID=A0A5B7CFR8_PORTR|nr:hypothetical protein [Portunus trituberculatus]